MDQLSVKGFSAGRSLRVFNPILISTSGMVIDLTSRAEGWRRSIRRNGGYWRGQLTLTGEILELAGLFYEQLGAHIYLEHDRRADDLG